MAIRRITAVLDQHNPDPGMRILKLAEETGEVAQAWIGYIGQNPRKGCTNSLLDVVDELADAALTALVAIQSLGYAPMEHLSERAAYCAERLEA